jgi:hypothetical protein
MQLLMTSYQEKTLISKNTIKLKIDVSKIPRGRGMNRS